jgi:hypothetical protein
MGSMEFLAGAIDDLLANKINAAFPTTPASSTA